MIFYICFQIKRTIYIFWNDFVESLKKKIKKYKNKTPFYQKKGLPKFERNDKDLVIKLNKKKYNYDFDENIQKPIYKTSILFEIIKNHKKKILENLIYIFDNSYNFKLKIGIELEFYAEKNIINDLKVQLPNVIIENERGKGQFEIKTKTYTNINLLVKDYINIIDILNKFNANLLAVPIKDDCGNALQLNISITDTNNNNLFARFKKNSKYIESDLLLKCLAGLLKNINNNLLLYIDNQECLERYDLNRNKNLKLKNKYPAPTFISWGINNRSASIRIPTPQIIDIQKYIEEDKITRRIEYRIPSAKADIYLVLIGIISSIIEGIDNSLFPHIEKTSYDVLYKNENLEKIITNINTLHNVFKINENILWF